MMNGIAHVCFRVQNLERSLDFYRDRLGLREAFTFRGEDGEVHGIYLHIGGRCFLELFLARLDPPAPGQSYQHLCFEVSDISETVGRLRASGTEVSDPHLGKDHAWQAWVTDPDGNRIELHAYTPESLQRQFMQ